MFVGTNSNRVIPPDKNLTMASVMAHRFEKLLAKGRFGSMRKPKLHSRPALFASFSDSSCSSSSSSSSESATLSAAAEEQSHFPPPSFIRPKASRMFAREEASPGCKRFNDTVDQPRIAANSTRLSRRLSISDSHSSSATSTGGHAHVSSANAVPAIPRRSSSLVIHNRDERPSLASLLHYEFTERESKNAERSLSSLCPPTAQPASPAQLEKPFVVDDIPPQPPLKYRALPGIRDNKNTETTSQEPIPQIVAAEDKKGSSEEDHQRRFRFCDSNQPSTLSCKQPASDLVLQEPAVGDFLGLSDDDIAELRPQTPVPNPSERRAEADSRSSADIVETLERAEIRPKSPPQSLRKPSIERGEPPTPPPAALPPTPLNVKRISARLSMGTSEDRAAAMAAFEVARIASRFDFDLIYIIDMWPKQMMRRKASLATARDIFSTPSSSSSAATAPGSSRSSTQTLSSSTQSPRSSESRGAPRLSGASNRNSGPGAGLDYRILAAYGLHTVKPPLDIAYGVHSKILKHDGWIEYRQSERNDNEFARGYACSFYTGYAPPDQSHSRCSSLETASDVDHEAASPASPRFGKGKATHELATDLTRSDHNRGIIFAAYRKQQPDGQTPGLSLEELKDMQLDAETLVDMIVDFHKVRRRSEQVSRTNSTRRVAPLSPSSSTNTAALPKTTNGLGL